MFIYCLGMLNGDLKQSVPKKTLSHYLLASAGFTGAELHAAVINGVLQIPATEIAAHLTECSCQSERRRDINWRHYPTLSALPFSSPLSLWRGAADRRREQRDRLWSRARQRYTQRGEERRGGVRDRAHVGCHAPSLCVAASKYPAPR